MDTVPVNDVQDTLTNFFHAVKTDTRAFNQPYKQSLGVDFDLSSDEEMMLIDGKNGSGLVNGDSLSPTSNGGPSDSDDLDDDTGPANPEDLLHDLQSDSDMQRALADMDGKMSVAEMERILSRYTLPTKLTLPAHESDTESSSSDGRKPLSKRPSSGLGKKRQRTRNSE